MGFMDKAKKMAEQAQAKLDEVQNSVNSSQGGQPAGDAPVVEYDKHGRPIQPAPVTPDAAAPVATPGVPPTASASTSPTPDPGSPAPSSPPPATPGVPAAAAPTPDPAAPAPRPPAPPAAPAGGNPSELLRQLEEVQRKEVSAIKAMVELLIERGVFTREEYLAKVKR